MLRRIGLATVVVCLLSAAIAAQTNPTYTLNQLTTNNTAACSTGTWGLLGTRYCVQKFPANSWYGNFTGGLIRAKIQYLTSRVPQRLPATPSTTLRAQTTLPWTQASPQQRRDAQQGTFSGQP